ncbi:MAG: aminotransferase class I/II-fold pyridoxal phosphate-dependent enzyme [Thermoprotei archaeon]
MPCDPSELRLYYNEFPHPPPKNVLEAARKSLADANRYPASELAVLLKDFMAKYAGVRAENVHAASGGEYVFYELFSRVVKPGDLVFLLEPTFSSYEPILRTLGCKIEKVPLTEKGDSWSLELDDLIEMAKREKPKLLVVDDPNNPTGSPMLRTRENVSKLLSFLDGYLLLDEAYTEYSGYSSADLVNETDNLVIFRTMSKAFAMAGMRVSFLLAPSRLVKDVEGFSPRFELSRPSMAAAVEALRDPSYALKNAQYVLFERERLYGKLLKLNGIKPYKSFTNFILMKFLKGIPKLPLTLMIPRFAAGFARISVGTKGDDDCAVRALAQALNQGPYL